MAKRKKTAPVEIWAMNYEFRKGIADGIVTDLHTGQEWHTNEEGYIKTELEVGRKLTLVFNHSAEDKRYPAVQTSTVVVPKKGLTGHDQEIAIQVPTRRLFNVLRAAIGDPKPGCRHVITTIQPHGKNMHDDLGVEGAHGRLYKEGDLHQHGELYLGSFGEKWFKTGGKTEWIRPITAHSLSRLSHWQDRLHPKSKYRKRLAQMFAKIGRKLAHTSTSEDGASFFLNVPVGTEYAVTAHKPGSEFTVAHIEVMEDSPLLINATPPHSPHEIPKPK